MIMPSDKLSCDPPLVLVVKYVPICKKWYRHKHWHGFTSFEQGVRYKIPAKSRLTSAVKKKRLSFANKRLHWTVEKREKFYSLTNLQFSSLQCRRGTFEDQNAKDSM